MAASVEIDESNGATETVTHAITKGDYGIVDTPNMTASANPIVPGNNSYEKWWRWHVTAMGGAISVRGFRFYATAPSANTTHNFNGHTIQASYDAANHKQTVFAQPATSPTRTPEAVPTSPPATANIGVAGSLTGELLAPGQTDYLVSQIRTIGAATAGTVLTASFRYDEIAGFLLSLGGLTAMIRAMEVFSGLLM